jgi:hypothetical protein
MLTRTFIRQHRFVVAGALVIVLAGIAGVAASGVLSQSHNVTVSKALTDSRVRDASFVSAKDGWALTNDGLRVTSDGGQSWPALPQRRSVAPSSRMASTAGSRRRGRPMLKEPRRCSRSRRTTEGSHG